MKYLIDTRKILKISQSFWGLLWDLLYYIRSQKDEVTMFVPARYFIAFCVFLKLSLRRVKTKIQELGHCNHANWYFFAVPIKFQQSPFHARNMPIQVFYVSYSNIYFRTCTHIIFIVTFVSLIFYTYIFNSIVKVTLTSSVLQSAFHYRVLRTFILRYHLAFIAANRIISY